MLEDILQILGSEKPFNEDFSLSNSGNISYNKLIQIIYKLQQMGVINDSDKIIKKLDYISSPFCEG
jgi:hypothetical protein